MATPAAGVKGTYAPVSQADSVADREPATLMSVYDALASMGEVENSNRKMTRLRSAGLL
eukprot:COSAG02_NODE_94_length_37427_cov_79.161728_15_plen_59_part_00